MHERYRQKDIEEIWSDSNKLKLWDRLELAVILARERLGQVPQGTYESIKGFLEKNPIDLAWWKAEDKSIGHDLMAYVHERIRHLPKELQQYMHQGITSYDTEEQPFATMILESVIIVEECLDDLIKIMEGMARKYRYTIMNARTHGQEAEMQTWGARVLTWIATMQEATKDLKEAKKKLRLSKLSGAIGKYGTLTPELESEALRILEFKPFYGATQIMPRVIYTPTAFALFEIVKILDKIANDIRLGARSGNPICREGFGEKQVGSSIMPHKRNPIKTEQITGMDYLVEGYLDAIIKTIKTWEERTIEMSSLERVAWPDLLHAAVHSLRSMANVLKNLEIYPDNMMREIIESRGTWAASRAQVYLKGVLASHGIGSEEAYRIVQLAAFNAFEPSEQSAKIRQLPPASFAEAQEALSHFQAIPPTVPISIRAIIRFGKLRVSSVLSHTQETVNKWNRLLEIVFDSPEIIIGWEIVFSIEDALKHENVLYKQILGE